MVFVLALLIAPLSPMAHAQEQSPKQRHVYSVKYVCGTTSQSLNNTGSPVAAGAYRTEINIQRAQNAGEARVSLVATIGRSVFSEEAGRTGTSYSTTLVGSEAVTVICQNINDLIDRVLTNEFRVGFVQIFSLEPLSVVAVYTAKHCRMQAPAPSLGRGLGVCEGDIALDVVSYDPVLVEPAPNG